MKDLIVVKQLPIIEEKLKELSEDIDKKVEKAINLVVSDETVKDVKKTRAELNAEFNQLEAQRKIVKEKVLQPYNDFEEVYNECVSSKYKQADIDLKTKINSVEKEQKEKKNQEIFNYYEELAIKENLSWLVKDEYYAIANINVTLSASVKSLKEKAKAFIEKVKTDLNLIETQEHKVEIMAEYKTSLNVSEAITKTSERFKREEEEKEQLKEREIQKEAEEEATKKIEEYYTKPETVKENLFTMTFTVKGTMNQLKKIKNYLEREGIKYE